MTHSNAKAKEGAPFDGRSCFVLNGRMLVELNAPGFILLFERHDIERVLYEQAMRRGMSLLGL